MRSACAALLAALTLLGARPARADGKPARNFVLVVANNRSLTPGVAPLRYADDDGARWYELLAPTATRISLFTVLDVESQRLFRALVPRAEAPTRAAILARLADYNRAMEAARAEGAEPVLTVVLIGHGEVSPAGEGFLSLVDAPLSRSELLREVIAPSKAAFNHLIIDACNAYLLVSRRGDDRAPAAADAIRRYVADEDLARYPTTGVVLSTSRAAASHEWSLFGGGVFSHEVRSALAGGADVNGDGRIEYSEVRAFVAAANARIDDPRARLDVTIRPPALDRSRPLVDLAASRFRHFVRLPAGASGRYTLEDTRGVRYADVNKEPDRPLVIALVGGESYFLRTDGAEVALRLDRAGTIDVAPSSFVPRPSDTRGPVEDAFHRHLFEQPFGAAYYHGFVESAGDLAVVDPPARPFVPPAAGSDGVDGAAIAERLAAARRRAGELALRRGDDRFVDLLLDWGAARLAAGDLREGARAVDALEHHLADVAIDRAAVARRRARPDAVPH